MILVFFVGLTIMVSGESISDVCNIAYLNIVCNIIGGIMMCVGVYLFIKKAEEKNELKLLSGQMTSKEEYEKELDVLRSVEKALHDNGKILFVLKENQKEIVDMISSKGAINSNIVSLKGFIEDNFSSLNEIEKRNTENVNTLITNTNEICTQISKITEAHSTDMKNLLSTIKSVENVIKKERDLICKSLDSILSESHESRVNLGVLHADNEEMLKQMCAELTKMDKNIKNVFGMLQEYIVKIQEVNCNATNLLGIIDQRIANINMLPEEISEYIEDLISKFEKTSEAIQSNYRYLSEDIKDQDKGRTKKFNSIMNEIRDTVEDNNGEMVEEIKKLASQYAEFEKIISTIVEQMSHMAEEDIKVMKGFLNG